MALNDKPNHAGGYDRNRTALIREACLEVATRLNDFKDDLCIVGGLVPSLLIDIARLPAAERARFPSQPLPGQVARPAPTLPEPHAAWVEPLEKEWIRRYS